MSIFKDKTLLITGGTGSFGNAVLRRFLDSDIKEIRIFSRDEKKQDDMRHRLQNPKVKFYIGNVRDRQSVDVAMRGVDYVFSAAALKQVPSCEFFPMEATRTNVLGTSTLLRVVKNWWSGLDAAKKASFRFLHISTDEVFGALQPGDPAFCETTPYSPNSPYSASKAASDHLVRAFHETYGLPVLVTNCSNNYGPRQFPEKLIPLMILNALEGKPLPVYGTGSNIRDWLHVEDHCAAIALVLEQGRTGESYNIGGHSERTNLEVVQTLCAILQEEVPCERRYADQIRFVTDRPGHDFRYAIDCRKLEQELGWKPVHSFASGLKETVRWYLAHREWVEHVRSGAYRDWMVRNYADRV